MPISEDEQFSTREAAQRRIEDAIASGRAPSEDDLLLVVRWEASEEKPPQPE